MKTQLRNDITRTRSLHLISLFVQTSKENRNNYVCGGFFFSQVSAIEIKIKPKILHTPLKLSTLRSYIRRYFTWIPFCNVLDAVD